MLQAVPFFRFEGNQRTPLFRILLEGSDLYAIGNSLGDAALILSRPIEVGERKIDPKEKPLDFFKSLPLAFGYDPLTAGEPVKVETTLVQQMKSEPVLVAWKNPLEYIAYDAGRLVDAGGATVSLDAVRRIDTGEQGWTLSVPLTTVLRLLGSTLPVPMPEEVSREFFAILARFRREYENWKPLYKRPENWTKVMIGNLALPHVKEMGLWEKTGRKFYPAVEPRKFGFSQGWLAPVNEPGTPDRTAVVVGELDRFNLVKNALVDFGQIEADLFVLSTYERSGKYVDAFGYFKDTITGLPQNRRPKAPVLVIVGPLPSELSSPWAEFRWEPETNKFNRTIWEL